MSTHRAPAFQFYTGDWRKDPCVQALDHAHKGVWIDLLCIMWDSVERGRMVLPNGTPMPSHAIARNLGIPEAEWKQVRSTLLDYGVASEDDTGVLYNRRMVRVERDRLQKVEAGRLGGLAKRSASTPFSESEANGGSTARKMKNEVEEEQIRNKDEEFEKFWAAYPKRAGGNPKNKALTRWRSVVKHRHRPDVIHAGAQRYAAYCEATKKVGTEYVMQATTFLGQNESWKETWDVPEVEQHRPQDEEKREADRMAQARSRESKRALQVHKEEEGRAAANSKAMRESFEGLPEDEQKKIEREVKKRARMIQPDATLTKLVLKGCFAQVMSERGERRSESVA